MKSKDSSPAGKFIASPDEVVVANETLMCVLLTAVGDMDGISSVNVGVSISSLPDLEVIDRSSCSATADNSNLPERTDP